MSRLMFLVLVVSVVLFTSCGRQQPDTLAPTAKSSGSPSSSDSSERSTKTPLFKTSIGDLVTIEKSTAIETSDKKFEPKADELLYLLTFEGKKELTFEGKPQEDGPNRILLVDSKGSKFPPQFAGTPADGGSISNTDWKYEGGMKGVGGKFVFAGKLVLPTPRIALVYLVPKSASDLTLKDGDQNHPLSLER
jgi:hypothetical protein